MTKTCLTCHAEFWTHHNRKLYCSKTCWYRSEAKHAAMRRGMARYAEGRRQKKFEREIKACGFWFTPELLKLCQSVYRRGYDSGRRSEEKRLAKAS